MGRRKKPAKPPGDSEWVEEARESTPEERAEAAKVSSLELEVGRLSKLLGLVETYQGGASLPPEWTRPKARPASMAATAILQLSDLHLDEVVNPAEVGGLNAYSREIAEMRLRRWAEKACELGDRFRHEWDGALILLQGDLVSGSIHEELRETNADVLPGTMVHWAPLLASAIRTVADFYGRVHIPSLVGNHGRLTIKMPAKRRGRNSWDWLLGQMVRAHLATDKRITWDVAQGSYLFVPIYSDHIYCVHGDEVGGGGGWAGVWSPLGTIWRRGMELAASHGLRISTAYCGHWHQLIQAHSKGLACNGSTKGVDEYSMSMRFKPEPAQQSWAVHTPKHGVTLAAPILVEDRKAEGW